MIIDLDYNEYLPYDGLTGLDQFTPMTVTSFRKLSEESVKLYVGDYGHTLYIYVGADLSGATEYRLDVQKPDGTETVWRPSLHTFGTTYNYLAYMTLGADLDQSGLYKIQPYVELSSWTGQGETLTLEVFELFN